MDVTPRSGRRSGSGRRKDAPVEVARQAVFLARSPHGSCLLRWDEAADEIEDPCYGSRFDMEGKYLFGPAPRDLDRLPKLRS